MIRASLCSLFVLIFFTQSELRCSYKVCSYKKEGASTEQRMLLYIFTYLFGFFCFVFHHVFLSLWFLLFFDEVSMLNMHNKLWTLTDQKQELAIRNCQWNCLHNSGKHYLFKIGCRWLLYSSSFKLIGLNWLNLRKEVSVSIFLFLVLMNKSQFSVDLN